MPELITLTVGALDTNCYIIGNRGRALIIDPGAEGKKITASLESRGWKPEIVINTHGHADHIGANSDFKKAGARIMIHRNDAEMLIKPEKNLSQFSGGGLLQGPCADEKLEEGPWEWQEHRMAIIHTPGHTPGGICIHWGQWLFSGDTLFAGGVGRTDLPGGNTEHLIFSIREKLFTLPGDIKVFPGHGPETTIAYEAGHNPVV